MQFRDLTATQIAEAVVKGKRSAVDLAKDSLSLAKSTGRDLDAFITICDKRAESHARAVDTTIKGGDGGHLPLAGVPIAVKDNICMRNCPTTCGSRMLESFEPPYDATVIDQLERAGAVIIGKTNLDEFAMGSSNETSFFGPVRHPAREELVPGGSSGGSASAVAAGIVPLALGSDTGGSVRQPAAFCGLFGLRPTYGAVSRYGLVAFASSFDQIGPFARTTEDLARLYSVIAGGDPNDATSVEHEHPEYHHLLNAEKPLTFGVPREYFADGLDPEIDAWVKMAIHHLLEAGHEVCEISLPLTDKAVATYYLIANAEASSNLARYDGVHYGHRADDQPELAQMYEQSRSEGFGAEVKRRIMLGTYALSSGYYDKFYYKAAQVRELLRREFDDIFKQVDVLVTPTTPTPAFNAGEKTSDPLAMYLSDVYTVAAPLAGIPALNVPFGQSSDGRPIGVQLMADRFNETYLFQLSHTLEYMR